MTDFYCNDMTTLYKRQLLYCWITNGFNVLVPKLRGKGYLRAPYGHHNDPGLNAIASVASCDIYGLDGSLEFVCGGDVFHGGNAKRENFSAVIVPRLEQHYGISAREIGRDEYWECHPIAIHSSV